MGIPGPGELIIIFLIILLIFGAKKVPNIAKDIGNGIKEFKKALTSNNDEDSRKKSDDKKS